MIKFVLKRILLIVLFYLIASSLFARTVRIATYNLGNYLIADRWVDAKYVKNYPKPESEKDALRTIIVGIRPDILVIQEMGDELFLKELQADLKSDGLDYQYIFLVDGPDKMRHIAVLSKESFIKTVAHANLNFKFFKKEEMKVRRGLLELKFKTEGIEWELFAVHLKSRRWGSSRDYESTKQRIGEAFVIRDKIKEQCPDPTKNNYIILGDFNDAPKSKTLMKFLKSGNSEISVMLPAEDSREEVWTYFREGHGTYSRLDYILISPSLLKRVKGKGASIVDTPLALKASDHRMVYVDIEFQPN